MPKRNTGRGNAPGSLEQLNKPLPRGHETKVFRVSAPVEVFRWLARFKDATARGRLLEQAMKAGLDDSHVTPETQDWSD